MSASSDLLALTARRIFDGERLLEGCGVLIREERIVDIVAEADIAGDARRQDLGDGLLAPGFVDLQVNGGGGVIFNDTLSVDGLRTIAAAHRQFGTTGMLPTLISDKPGTIPAAMAAIRDAMDQGVPGILGAHIEGPFLNVARKGVHDPAVIRRAEPADIEALMSLGVGRTLVTLAPETAPDGMIRKLADAGIRVAAGHTAANYEQIMRALKEGLTGFTHLFNAMTPLEGRSPGVVGAALDDPESWCGLIADGIHVDPASLRVAIAAKPHGKMFLVTDAMATVGAEEKTFQLYGETITEKDGRLTTAEGTLAGAALDMATAVRNAVTLLNLPLEEALRMASLYPAAFMGLEGELGRIAPGYRADLVLLDEDMQAIGTWIGGDGG